MAGARVEVDLSKLTRYVDALGDALERDGLDAAQRSAEQCAREIEGQVPVLTGRLRSSVTVAGLGDGYGVSYGAGVPYARKIERRDSTVAQAIERATDPYYRAQLTVAQEGARRA